MLVLHITREQQDNTLGWSIKTSCAATVQLRNRLKL
jgi:hypothetical protein